MGDAHDDLVYRACLMECENNEIKACHARDARHCRADVRENRRRRQRDNNRGVSDTQRRNQDSQRTA